jgi:parvulin-like peptidyl-prolyl isomerase
MKRWSHRWPRRLATHPVLHFAAIGAVLFVLHGLWNEGNRSAGGAAPPRPPIVITAERVREMQTDFENRWGTPPTAAQLRALVNQVVEEEILAREARLLALDFGDASVRRRLLEKARAVSRDPSRGAGELLREAQALGLDDDLVIQRLLATKMRLLLQQEDAGGPIPEAEIAEYYQRHGDLFLQPRTVTFTHVFLDRGTRGARLTADADAALARLDTASPAAAGELSDPFPLGQRLVAYTDTQLTGRFGKAFADRVLALEPGSWAGPLSSPYGVHLVRVEEHSPARRAPLEGVRDSIRTALRKERAASNLGHGLARLRGMYEVRIEDGGEGFAAEPAPNEVPSS